MNRETADWSKVARVPFAELKTVLPDEVLTLHAAVVGGANLADGAYAYTEAHGEYMRGEREVRIDVSDDPRRAAELLLSRTSMLEGHPVVDVSHGADAAGITIVVADRFVVTSRTTRLAVDHPARRALETVDLATLASWKDRGE
jgi:hypothetical protein